MKQRNRAKCNLCGDIIESIAPNDLQMCGCGQIGVDGGLDKYLVIYKDPANFLRIDDDDKIFPVTERMINNAKEYIKESIDDTIRNDTELPTVTKNEMVEMLKLHIQGFDNLPDHAKHQPASLYDVQCLAMMIYGILRN